MRAARFYGKEDIRIETVDEPNPDKANSKVLVEISWCGICGSDLHEYIQGAFTTPTKPHPLTGQCTPLTLGHEICGRVINPAGNTSHKLQHNDPVMIDPRITCHKCGPCRSSHPHGCEILGYVGGSAHGGYAERVLVDESSLHKLPPGIDLDYAAVIEPMAVVWHAIREVGWGFGPEVWGEKDILVLGGGPIGSALIIALKAAGANLSNVAVSEPTSRRREMVRDFGVAAVINPIRENVVKICKDKFNGPKGAGPEIIFDCAGVPAGIEVGMQALRFGGVYMNVAVWEKPMAVPLWSFMTKHITIKSALIFSDEDFAETISMMAEGKLEGYEKLVTGRINLEDIVEKGFKELIHHKDDHIKILVSSKA